MNLQRRRAVPVILSGGGTSYYVDQTAGVDTNVGSQAAPWKTIAKVNGQTYPYRTTIYLKRGETWAEKLTIPSSGMTITNYGAGALPLITGSGTRDHAIYGTGKSNTVIDGVSATATVWETIDLRSASNCVIKNCTVVLGGNNGIYLNAVTGFDIYNNTITQSNGNGIGILSGVNGQVRNNDVAGCGLVTDDRSGISVFTGCSGVRVHHNISHDHTNAGAVGIRGIILDTTNDGVNYCYQNIVHHCDGAGIYVYRANNQWVYYNIAYANGSVTNWNDGIKFQLSTGGYCYNNTCYGNRNSSIRCLNTNGVTVKNNIGWQTGNYCFITEGTDATTHTADYNCFYGVANEYNWNGTAYANAAAFTAATTQGAHDTNADPACVSNADYHLQAGSPCINTGVAVGLTEDFDGVAVGSPPEIGAYEV